MHLDPRQSSNAPDDLLAQLPAGSALAAALSRRAFVLGGVTAGLALLAACGNDDAETFATTATSATGATAGTAATSGTAGAADTAAVSDTSGAVDTVAASGTDGVVDTAASGDTATPVAGTASGTLAINFSWAPTDSGGRVRNPYIAVWIEDADSQLVRTVSLWYKSNEPRYVNHLTTWYEAASAVDETDLDTISSATRVAGAYSVEWDGTDLSGAPVAAGNYFVCIEAAREHGPYELIRDTIAWGSGPVDVTFADNGELTAASATLVA